LQVSEVLFFHIPNKATQKVLRSMLTPSFKTAAEHGKQITALKQITGICKALLQKHYEHKMIRNVLQPRAMEQNRTERITVETERKKKLEKTKMG
jgi:hypothetical protein